VDAVALVLVGQTDDAAAADRGVLGQHGLDLGGVHVGPPAEDHVRLAVARYR
jgi:hypothetical protein